MSIKPLLPLILTLLSGVFFVNFVTAKQQELKQYSLPEFSAQYTVLHKSKPVGTGVRKLTYQADGTINFHYQTDIEWLIFSQVRAETSIVTIINNQVIPQHYTYTREGTGKDKRYEWSFDAANNKATDIGRKKEPQTLDFSKKLQDTLSYHLQHRLNLLADSKQKSYVYSVIKTSGSVKDYIYNYDGEEELMLPYGLIKAIRFKRQSNERITYTWFAPKLDYLLVKIYQTKSGNEQFEAQLSSYSLLPEITK